MALRLALLAFACGTLGVQFAASLLPWTSVACATVAAVMLARGAARERGPRAARIACAVVAALLGGVVIATVRAHARLDDALPRALEGVPLLVTGVVDGMPTRTADGVRFAFRVESAEPDATLPSRLALGWYAPRERAGTDTAQGDAAPSSSRRGSAPPPSPQATPLPTPHAGERWRLAVKLKRPHGALNFAGFDVEAWLFERGLRATGAVRDDARNERLAAFAGDPRDLVDVARERIRDRLVAALGERRYAGVVVALAIGDQAAIPETQWRVFNATGIAHLISISGLHITVFATLIGGAAWRIVRRFPAVTQRVPARRVAAAIGLAAATVYTLLSGAEIPALRTLLMLAVATLGLWMGLPGTAGIVWVWALAAVLVVDPWASIAPGFWLSFGAVGLLLYAGTNRLTPCRPQCLAARMRANLEEGCKAQWVVTVGLAPGTLALFQQLSLVAPLANAIAIPVVTFAVVPLALLAIVVPVDALPIAAHAVLEPLMRYLEWLAQAPHAAWQQHAPRPWTVVVATVGVLWLVAPRGVPGRMLGLVAMLPLVLVVPARPPPGQFDMMVLDVGQGLAALVRTAEHTLLFDTGPRFGNGSDAGGRIVVPALRAAGAGALDRLVISHADSDHSGGALSVLAALPVGRVDSSLEWTHPIVAVAGPRAHRCAAGERWTWDGVEFAMLHPFANEYADASLHTNNRSCVLRVSAPGFTVLLTGDIEARDERALLAAGAPLAADVIVVPHHGSRTSSTPDFVAAVDARVAVFTAGYLNRFGHPRPDVVARYARRDASSGRSAARVRQRCAAAMPASMTPARGSRARQVAARVRT